MTVHPRLEAPKQGIALGVFESHQVRLYDAVNAVQIDVVLDAVGEDGGLQLNIFRGKIEAEVGFEMPSPVVICAIPGCLAMASMRLVEGSWRSSFAFRMVMGIGDSFIFMSPKAPVTITSFNFKCLKNISVESGRLCAVIGNTASISNGR